MEEKSPAGEDLASYEGKYSKDLFNKTVVVDGQSVGHVAKETDDMIVVFGDSDNSRFDVPKSKIAIAGGSVTISEPLAQYAVDRDAPLPEGKSLRPSADEIRQVAGEVGEETLPVPESQPPSAIEEKVREVVGEVKSSVGYEIGQAGKAVKEKLADTGEAIVSGAGVEEAASKAAGEVKDLTRQGAEATKEKLSVSQNMAESSLSAENTLRAERQAQSQTTEADLGSYEGKYPKDLFRKAVVTANDRNVGYVAKETEDLIVVFSDTDSSLRFDIPKSEIALEGGSVLVNEDLLFRYRMRRDDPLPSGKALRASAEEIRAAAAGQAQVEEKNRTTPEAIIEEGSYLSTTPRPETTHVSRPEGYVDTEAEIVKQMKRAVSELKEIIIAGTRVAKKKARQAQEAAAEKQAEMDAESISRMGSLALTFADSFEDVLSEIRTRTFADQVQIYTGFLKLMDQQRDLVLARRDLAARLKDSVSVPVVEPGDMDAPKLGAPPKLPETIDDKTTKGKTTRKKKQTTKKSRTSVA
ncbi:MAG TPA: hypothetical protein VHL10_02770 [Nitrososphaera sp.]|jgi:hypothetical protein|nr:hypothetical protein [Nitrososphaera sp.]